MKLALNVYWGEEEIRQAVINLNPDKFEPLSEEEKEAAVEMIIRDYINQHLTVRWELEEDEG